MYSFSQVPVGRAMMAVVGQLGLLECGRNCWQQKTIDKICI